MSHFRVMVSALLTAGGQHRGHTPQSALPLSSFLCDLMKNIPQQNESTILCTRNLCKHQLLCVYMRQSIAYNSFFLCSISFCRASKVQLAWSNRGMSIRDYASPVVVKDVPTRQNSGKLLILSSLLHFPSLFPIL